MSNARNIFALSTLRRRGFTFVELMLGLLVTALVMTALSLTLAAVGQGWTQSEATQSGATLTSQTHLRVQKYLKSAALIGAIRAGAIDNSAAKNAAMLIWKNDANHDWKIQFGEVALIEYFPSGGPKDANTIRYYEAKPQTAAEIADASQQIAGSDGVPNNNALYTDSNIDSFKLCTYVKYTVLARNVQGCAFHKSDAYTASRPEIDYMFKITGPSGVETDYGTVALRTPATMPVEQR